MGGQQYGKRVDNNWFTLVNFNKKGHHDKLFILASQVKQVFYIKDMSNWSVILTHKQTKFDNFYVCDIIEETPSFSKGVATLDNEEENDDTLVYVCDNWDREYIDTWLWEAK